MLPIRTSPLAVFTVAEPAAVGMLTSPLAVRARTSPPARAIRTSPETGRTSAISPVSSARTSPDAVAARRLRAPGAAGRVRVQFGQLSGAGDVGGRGAHRAA